MYHSPLLFVADARSEPAKSMRDNLVSRFVSLPPSICRTCLIDSCSQVGDDLSQIYIYIYIYEDGIKSEIHKRGGFETEKLVKFRVWDGISWNISVWDRISWNISVWDGIFELFFEYNKRHTCSTACDLDDTALAIVASVLGCVIGV